jgi:hypothetical protein
MYSKEFAELVANDNNWQKAMLSPRSIVRHEIPDADQTFSSVASRRELTTAATAWLLEQSTP